MSQWQPTVRVYVGEGAGARSAASARSTLRSSIHRSIKVAPLTTNELLEGQWAMDCMLLVMPGGADLPYCRQLNGHGNHLIRDYVQRGGSYLGLCAGAYYASSRVVFEPDTPLQVVGNRQLAFFAGEAHGAAYPGVHGYLLLSSVLFQQMMPGGYAGFDYRSEAGAVAAPISFLQLKPSMCWPSKRTCTVDEQVVGHPNTCTMQQSANSFHSSAAVSSVAPYTADAALAPPPLCRQHLIHLPSTTNCMHSSNGSSTDGPADVSGDGSHAGSADQPQQLDSCLDYSNGGPVFVACGTNYARSCQHGLSGQNAGPVDSTSSMAIAPTMSDARSTSTSCSLLPGDDLEGATVLATYAGLGQQAAAVRCMVGAGVAVLCGTHPELSGDWLQYTLSQEEQGIGNMAVAAHRGTPSDVVCAAPEQSAESASVGGASVLSDGAKQAYAELIAQDVQRSGYWAMLLAACCSDV